MKKIFLIFIIVISVYGCNHKSIPFTDKSKLIVPIKLHPENSHYFLYKGKTLALISSSEHYGALINKDFDFKKYLNTLAKDGMNYTRLFTGTYFEIPQKSFGIQNNTLAPVKESLIIPWKMVIESSDELKYDLSKWNDDYFKRLKEFIQIAAENDIIVEITLFSSIYSSDQWNICPQNSANNINVDNKISKNDIHTLNNGILFDYQADFVRKMVQELNEFDNLFFEIQNEPWADRVVAMYNIINHEELKPDAWRINSHYADKSSMIWQDSIASIIHLEEKKLQKQHLIAQNYTNYKIPIPTVSKNISIINFHYAWPEAVEWNYQYDKVIGFDETGFAGSENKVYRRQAWKFMLSGGGLFNNLDYSFFVGHEDGLGENDAPGGGSKILREQLKGLSDFLHSFKLEKLKPNYTSVTSSRGLIPFVLSDGNKSYAIYLRGIGTTSTKLKLQTGEGVFKIFPFNTIKSSYGQPTILQSENGLIEIDVQIPDGELALKIVRD